jgi:AraC-like DNA-binding protein
MLLENPVRKKEAFGGQKVIAVPHSVIENQCTKDAIISSLYITNIGYYDRAHNHYCRRDSGSGQHILIYCTQGKGKLHIDGNKYHIEEGMAVLIPQNTPHTYYAHPEQPWTIFWMHFKGSKSAHIVDRFKKLHGIKAPVSYGGRCVTLFHEMYGQLERGYSIDTLINVNMCLWHFLSSFLYNETKLPVETAIENKTKTEFAIDYLTRNVDRAISLSDVAKAVNLSPSHFAAVFKGKTGFSPIEYFNQLKVQKACQYLQFTDLRIKDISNELGIADYYYFSRLFTKTMGISPLVYRRQKLNYAQ